MNMKTQDDNCAFLKLFSAHLMWYSELSGQRKMLFQLPSHLTFLMNILSLIIRVLETKWNQVIGLTDSKINDYGMLGQYA